MSNTTRNYSNIADMKSFWIDEIAPNYFDMEDVNNYQVGIFGYINELMANANEDAFNAINIARREFYPITAMYNQSLYKMASMQKINLPMATPSTAKAILLMKEKDIIKNGVFKNGVYTYVLDNTLKIMAGDIPFLLDFPIIIISKQDGDRWIHTSHYDVSLKNELSTNANRYIANKVIHQNGEKYLLLSILLRQVTLETVSQLVVKDNIIDTVTMDFHFQGNLANFEVFYKASVESETEVQLRKLVRGASTPQTPFCYYEFLDSNIIRLTFMKNPYFNPGFNSEIIMNIYTSMGSDGDFDVFKDSLLCTPQSSKYPYNNTLLITGKINGKSSGGRDKLSDDEFRSAVVDAYSTNNTITTSTDLQIYFDKVAREGSLISDKSKILFRKKRDDALIRLFGAYLLLKDQYNNVVPTNVLDVNLLRSEITDAPPSDSINRLFIKPGTLFEYKPDIGEINYTGKKVADLALSDDLDMYDDNSRFLFTNPFLIAITLNPNIVGYYLNSLSLLRPIEYNYINDNTLTQFIASGLRIDRNALMGENFYRIHMTISPSAEMDPKLVVIENDSDDDVNIIRASENGIIYSIRYEDDGVYATITYDNNTEEIIQVNNIVKSNGNIFEYSTGYNIQFEIGTKFIKNDILAIKKDTDLGRIRTILDFSELLMKNDYYIPFTIEKYDSGLNSYDIAAYISTDDTLTLDAQLLIEHGILDRNGVDDDNMVLPINNLDADIHVFYNNPDINFPHRFPNFKYMENFTLTNSYSLDSTEDNYRISLVQQIDFIRSTINFEANPDDPLDFGLLIKEMPLAKANWCKSYNNFKYLVDNINSNYTKLKEVYFLLENNYGIDLKFFNTYGKSRFFRVGIKTNTVRLNSVNCSFSFGVYLTSLTPPESFLSKFRTFVKDYIESINNVNSSGQSIYIMNLISDLKAEFSEIGYIEYYGLNTYDHEAQKIEGMSEREILESGLTEYIPEFINIRSSYDGIMTVPKVDVFLLKK